MKKLMFLLPALVAVFAACSTSERLASNDAPQVSVEPAADCADLGDACLTGGAGHCCSGLRCVGSVCVK